MRGAESEAVEKREWIPNQLDIANLAFAGKSHAFDWLAKKEKWRMTVRYVGVIAGLFLSCYAGVTYAHHAFSAEFDANSPVTLEGTIAKMEWVNPHAWLWVDVTNENGTVDAWAVEFGPPNALFRRGWRKSSVPIGANVTVTGYLAKDGRKLANANQVTLPDGRRLFAGSSGTGAPYESTEEER